jgi:hypothetical protein
MLVSSGTRPVESVARVEDDDSGAAPANAAQVDEHEGPRLARPELAPDPQDPLAAFGEGVTTDLGGALYLINLLTALDLPEGWPARPDRPVGLTFWGLLELVARHLLSDPGMDQDPLWALLAVLDHREPGAPPAGRVAADACIRLPLDWLDGAGAEAGIRCRVDGGRLRCWIGDLPVLDGPDPGSEGARRALLAGLGRPAAPDASGTPTLSEDPGASACPHPDPGLRRWLALLLPFLRWRLAGAMRLPAADPAALDLALLRCRARLYLSGPHLDMVAPLHAISLPVRRAGLDRDPGWLAAPGRVVSFHFRETTP